MSYPLGTQTWKIKLRKTTSTLFPKVLKIGGEFKALRNFWEEYL